MNNDLQLAAAIILDDARALQFVIEAINGKELLSREDRQIAEWFIRSIPDYTNLLTTIQREIEIQAEKIFDAFDTNAKQ